MNLRLQLLEKKDIHLFNMAEEEAFKVHDRYFSEDDGHCTEEDEHEEDLNKIIDNPKYTVLAIYDGDMFVGGAIVEDSGNHVKDISIFFLIVEYQSKGIGKTALDMVEAYFPDTKIFRLITPSQVIRNTVFYVNKCGYHIVKVVDFNKDKNTADYVFEKRRRKTR